MTQASDLGRFPSIPRATQRFERKDKGRTAVERVHARLKVVGGIDDGQVYGARRFPGHVGAVMVVHLAFATLRARAGSYEGTYGKMTFAPIANALHELIRGPAQQAAEVMASVSVPTRCCHELGSAEGRARADLATEVAPRLGRAPGGPERALMYSPEADAHRNRIHVSVSMSS